MKDGPTHIDSTEPPLANPEALVVEGTRAGSSSRLQTAAQVTLAILAVFYALSVSSEVLIPFLLAIVFKLLLQPAMRFLSEHLRLPAPISALLLIVALFGVLAGLGGRHLCTGIGLDCEGSGGAGES
jgi:hypothetical protein